MAMYRDAYALGGEIIRKEDFVQTAIKHGLGSYDFKRAAAATAAALAASPLVGDGGGAPPPAEAAAADDGDGDGDAGDAGEEKGETEADEDVSELSGSPPHTRPPSQRAGSMVEGGSDFPGAPPAAALPHACTHVADRTLRRHFTLRLRWHADDIKAEAALIAAAAEAELRRAKQQQSKSKLPAKLRKMYSRTTVVGSFRVGGTPQTAATAASPAPDASSAGEAAAAATAAAAAPSE